MIDTMLGQIKDIVQPRDVSLYDIIRIEVEKKWEKLNIPLHTLEYVLTPKYYHTSWLETPAPGGGLRKKAHQDPEVQVGYIQALDKLYPDEEECNIIWRQLTTTSMAMVPFGPTMQIEIEGIFLLLSGGTCMVVLLHSYNIWQQRCFHRW